MNKQLNAGLKQKEDRYTELEILISKLKSKISALNNLNNKFSNYRLSIFLSGILISLLLFFFVSDLISIISFAAFTLLFMIVAHLHSTLLSGIKKHHEWLKIKEVHLARMNLNWQEIPNITLNAEPTPTEVDLNLAGSQSLHHLINTSVSKKGRQLLRDWLSGSSPKIEEILRRQNLVKDLIPLQRLRDKLILFASLSSKKELDGSTILNWLKYIPPQGRYRGIFLFLAFLAPINIILTLLFFLEVIPAYFIISLLIYMTVYFFGNRRKKDLLADIEPVSDELRKFTSILTFLEEYPYKHNSHLKNLCKVYVENKPSVLVMKIKNAVSTLRLRHGNPFVWTIIRLFFPVDYFYLIKIETYKKEVKEKLPVWLEVLYEIEALSSLANFAYLNPQYIFPDIVKAEKSGDVNFEAVNAGHPLIKDEKKVTNSFSFNSIGDSKIITGSNMSGKSTFLRTLGINLSLAYAGSVTDTEKFTVSLFNIFTCIKVSDSVIDGISYFYAEVKRLRVLLDLLSEENEYPIFYLIDEIFRGTNNVERLKGSRAFVKKLSISNAVGAIATHDLELVHLSEQFSNISNFHFKEEVVNDKMIFDYKIHQGPCPTTNALKIMQMEGLPVE